MITYKFISKDEFIPLFRQYRPEIFVDNHDVDLSALFSEEEKTTIQRLEKMCTTEYRLYLTAWDDNKLVGWSWGFQISGVEFYMCNSAVFPSYRRQGIYSEMMNIIVNKAKDDGFQEITSKHHADNNSVIIPKLKSGFLIRGFEVNARFGLLVNLIYYQNEKIKNVHQMRIGSKKSN